MKFSRYRHNAPRVRLGIAAASAVGLLVAIPLSAQAAQPPVGLGTAASYAVLAGSTVTSTRTSIISGDLGVSPGSAVVGFPPGIVVNGTQHVADAAALQAKADLTVAYDDAAGRTPATAIPVELGGQTLKPGVYSGGTLGLTGRLTLDAGGDSSAVFIFTSASTLITATDSRVRLLNGASPCNVFWQVTSSATIGDHSVVSGTIMALTNITLDAGAKIDGRVLARNGAVTMIDNTITRFPCGPSPTPTPTPTPTSTGTTTGTTTGHQVTQVPIGSVASGDGSTSGGGTDTQGLLVGGLLFAGVGAATAVAVRRSRRLNS